MISPLPIRRLVSTLGSRDTIYALATAPGRAGVGIVRISGPRSLDCLGRLTGRGGSKWVPRQLSLCTIREHDGTVLDRSMAVVFEAGNSFTGESVVELHVHGSAALYQAIFRIMASLSSARDAIRLARPGEFSMRAFQAGRMSLSQCEAVADLIAAESESQLRVAAWQASHMDAVFGRWREGLLRALTRLEAAINFEEEDASISSASSSDALRGVAEELRSVVAASERHGQVLRQGLRMVIVGEPNAGKSSLFNALLGRPQAIVSPRAGTTRDLLVMPMEVCGHRVQLVDTAGLQCAGDGTGGSSDELDEEGQRRAREEMRHADIVIHLHDDRPANPAMAIQHRHVLCVHNKADLHGKGDVRIQASTGRIEQLLAALEPFIRDRQIVPDSYALVTQQRHIAHLRRALEFLDEALSADGDVTLVADAVYRAVGELAAILGGMQNIGTEDVLGSIFSSYCIGK